MNTYAQIQQNQAIGRNLYRQGYALDACANVEQREGWLSEQADAWADAYDELADEMC